MVRVQPSSPIALRGTLVSFAGDPFLVGPDEAVHHESDGLIVCRDGLIEAVGPYHDLRRELPADIPVADYSGCIISAGFIDSHIHYVQTGIIAAPGKRLLDWVNDYVYPAEKAFADEAHARAIASFFCDTLLRSGTTTPCVYCAVYPQSIDALFAEAEKRNMRMIAGKCMMDRNVPEALRDTAKTGYDQSRALIENGTAGTGCSMPSRRAGRDRARLRNSKQRAPCGARYPRTACADPYRREPRRRSPSSPSSSPSGRTFSMSTSTLAWSDGAPCSATPSGSLSRSSAVATSATLRSRIARPPTCSSAAASSACSRAKESDRPIHVGIGTDIGAGTSFSQLASLNGTYKIAALNRAPITAFEGLYLATRGGARALDLDERDRLASAGRRGRSRRARSGRDAAPRLSQ